MYACIGWITNTGNMFGSRGIGVFTRVKPVTGFAGTMTMRRSEKGVTRRLRTQDYHLYTGSRRTADAQTACCPDAASQSNLLAVAENRGSAVAHPLLQKGLRRTMTIPVVDDDTPLFRVYNVLSFFFVRYYFFPVKSARIPIHTIYCNTPTYATVGEWKEKKSEF